MFITVTNRGPSAIDLYADAANAPPVPNPPHPPLRVPPLRLSPGNSMTLGVTQQLRLALGGGGSAKGDYVFSWCCPSYGIISVPPPEAPPPEIPPTRHT